MPRTPSLVDAPTATPSATTRPRAHRRTLVDTTWSLWGECLRVALSAATFILVARALGASGFGVWSAALAVVSTANAFSSLGSGNLMVIAVARQRAAFRRAWSEALVLSLFGAVAATLLLLIIKPLLLPGLSAPNLVLLCLAELVFATAVGLAAQGCLACEQLQRIPTLWSLYGLTRLCAVAAFAWLEVEHTVGRWVVWHLGASVVAGVGAVLLASLWLGPPSPPARPRLSSVRHGLPFAVSAASLTAQDDTDKTFLVRFGFSAAAGQYAAAYRVAMLGFLPARALLMASYVDFFRDGPSRGPFELAKRRTGVAVALTSAVAILMFIAAPLLLRVMGPDFEHSVVYLRVLCVLPVIRACQYFAADALTATGRQPQRMVLQLTATAFGIALYLALIPWQGVAGAIVATFLAEATYAVLVWTALLRVTPQAAST